MAVFICSSVKGWGVAAELPAENVRSPPCCEKALLDPEKHCVPVNQKNDFEGDQGIFKREPQQISVIQRRALAGKRGDENFFLAITVVNFDVQVFARNFYLKMKIQIQG